MEEQKVPNVSAPISSGGELLVREGRWSGGFLLAQIAGLIGPFILLLPLVRLSPLERLDAGSVAPIKAALFWLALSSLTALAITAMSWRTLGRVKGLRVALLASAAAVFVFQLIDNAHLFALLSLHGPQAGATGAEDALRLVTETEQVTRGWVHRSELFAVDLWIALFYTGVLQCRLIPRWMAVTGVATVVLHFFALVVPLSLGLQGFAPLGALMALTHLTSGVWLLAKGYVGVENHRR